MSCIGTGNTNWYLYDSNWSLIKCVSNNLTSYSFTGITDPGVYNVIVINNGYTGTTQFTITGNEEYCWDAYLYQSCDETCPSSENNVLINKTGDNFEFNYTPSGSVEIFFKKINDILGFNGTKNISSRVPDISTLYGTGINQGVGPYFLTLLRAYECCSIDLTNETDITITTPCVNEPLYKILRFCNTCSSPRKILDYYFDEDCECTLGSESGPSCSGTTCLEHWDLKFLRFTGDCTTRHLVEFGPVDLYDPISGKPIYISPSFSADCRTNISEGFEDCNCFYIAIGYRNNEISDHYARLNLVLQDCDPLSISGRTLTYNLRGRSVENYNTGGVLSFLSNTNTSSTVSTCPIQPGCDCLDASSVITDNGGYPINSGGTAVYSYNEVISLTNECYLPFDISYVTTIPQYTGLTIDTSNFNGRISRGENAELTLNYTSTSQTPLLGLIVYSATTTDDFNCDEFIDCSGVLSFSFTPKPVNLIAINGNHDFGGVGNGCCSTINVDLKNLGESTITIYSATLTDSNFEITNYDSIFGSPIVLSQGLSETLVIEYCSPSGCTGGTVSVSDIQLNTNYGLLTGIHLYDGFSLSGTCINPVLSASPSSFVYIKQIDESLGETLYVCNLSDYEQTVGMSDCLTETTGSTINSDPLGNGFQISYSNEIISTIDYPRTFNILPNSCNNFEIEYTTQIPDKTICTIYLTDNCGNQYNIPFTGYSLPYPIGLTSVSTQNPTCHGQSDGVISIGFSGGTEIFTYTFSGETGFVQSGIASNPIVFQNLPAEIGGTTYVFSLSGDPCNGTQLVTDLSPFIIPGDPETQYGPYYITLNGPEQFSIINTDYTGVTCVDLGSASVTVSGGVTNYIFTWSNGFIETGTTTPYTSTATGLTSGIYSILIDDNNGCQLTTTIEIPVRLPILSFTERTNVSCYGNFDGEIYYRLINAIDPVTYSWSGYTYDGYSVTPSHPYDSYTASTAINLTAGTYVVSYIDGNSCTGTSVVTVTQPNPLGFLVSSTPTTCSYLDDGKITFNPITGGTSPYTLYASGGTQTYSATTGSVIPELPSDYYLSYIIDSNGCTTPTQGILVDGPDPITFTLNYTATTCIESTDGRIEINVNGGTAPYSYIWLPALSTTNVVTNATAGNYNLTIFDSNDCYLTTGFTLPYVSTHCSSTVITDENDTPFPTIGGKYIIGFPYTCVNNQTEITVNLCQYSPCPMTITNVTGNTTSVDDFYRTNYLIGDVISSSGCTQFGLIFNPTSATTYNSEFGIDTTYCHYDFILSGVGVNEIFSASTTFVDFGGVCFGSASTQNITIYNLTPDDRDVLIQTTPVQFTPSNIIVSLSAYSSQNIPITFTPTYPNTYPPVRYLGFNGTSTINGCENIDIPFSGYGYAGEVYVSGVDFGCLNQGCSGTTNATIYNYHCLPVEILSASLLGPVGSYTSINNFTGGTIPAGGTMDVNITYHATNQLNTFLFVNVDSIMFGSVYSGVTGCMVYPLGEVLSSYDIITVPGVSQSLTIPITNTSDNILSVGVSITDLTGGTPSSFTISPGPIMVIPAPVYPSTGVTSNLTLTFNDSVNVTEEFILTLTDGCHNTREISIFVNSLDLGLSSYLITNPSCYGDTNGSIIVVGSGGTSPYTYVWDTGITADTITNLSAGTYNLTVYDFFNNNDSFTFTLTQPNSLGLGVELSQQGSYNVGIYGNNSGWCDLTVTGGTTPYSYFWSGITYNGIQFTSTDEDLSNVYAGTYSITVTDLNLCQVDYSFVLTQPNPITIEITNCTPPVPPATSCMITGGTAELSVSGGECPYYVVVCPTTPQNPLFAVGGPFYGITTCVTLQDCSLVLSGTPCVETTCYCCDQSVIPLTGCTEGCPCTHCDITINNLPPGNYPPGTFGVIDSNSGSTTYNQPTVVPDLSTLGFTLTSTPTTCDKIDDGEIIVTIVPTPNDLGQIGMGVPPYTYYINGTQDGSQTSSTTHIFEDLSIGDYLITVVDSDGNSVNHSIRVSQNRILAGISVKSETENDQDGSITIVHITGGVGPFTGQITTTEEIPVTAGYIFEHLVAGDYLLVIKDSIGCEFKTTVRVPRVLRKKEGEILTGKKKAVTRDVKYEQRLGGFKVK